MASLSYKRQGAGEPIVLVHGLGSRWQVFSPILAGLARTHEVVAIDLPGFGGSPLYEGVVPGPHGYAEWLATWLTENGIERPHLVGSSMGGGVALELGRRGVASSVTAFAPVGFWRTPGIRWSQGMLTVLRSAAQVAGPVVGRALEHPLGRSLLLAPLVGRPASYPADAARCDIEALGHASAFAEARDDFANYRLGPHDDAGSLGDIPVTIAWGTRDVVLTHRRQSARAREALPAARHIDIRHAGHLPFHDDPEACTRIVLDTIAREAP